MRNITIDRLQVLQEQRKEHHSKKRKIMKVFLRKKAEVVIPQVVEVVEDTPQETKTVDDIIFFDGHDPAEIRMLFTPTGQLKKAITVRRELRLLPKIKLRNRPQPKREYIREAKPIPVYIPDPRNIVRVPEIPKEHKPYIRPPARYDNRSREEIINQYLEA